VERRGKKAKPDISCCGWIEYCTVLLDGVACARMYRLYVADNDTAYRPLGSGFFLLQVTVVGEARRYSRCGVIALNT